MLIIHAVLDHDVSLEDVARPLADSRKRFARRPAPALVTLGTGLAVAGC